MLDTDYQKREAFAVHAIKKVIPLRLKSNLIPESKGMFTELYEQNELFPDYYCATTVDGVGTKLLIAIAMNTYDTIGIDCVAMNVNDMACYGRVSPFMFIDYLACQSKIEELGITGTILKGIVKGLALADTADIFHHTIKVNLGKGETASVDELLSCFKPGYGFDIAGCMIGFIKKSDLHTKISIGNKIIALKSSGVHSNGYTDLRTTLLTGDFETRAEIKKRYKGKYRLDDPLPHGNGKTIGEELLTPTKIYMQTIAAIAKRFPIVGINNTGYGLKNFNRIKGNFEFRITKPMKPQPIFELMQQESGFSDKEMYQRFNMGMGFFVIAERNHAKDILSIIEKYGDQGKIVGEVCKGKGEPVIVLEKGNKKIVFEGY